MRIDRLLDISLYENFGSGYPLDKKSREFYGIVYFCGSREKLFIDGKTCNLTPGTVTFFRRGERYRVELPDNYLKCYVINFDASDAGKYIVASDCADMLPLFEDAARIWQRHRDDEYYRLDCASLTYKIFAELCRRRDRAELPLRKKERLAPVIDHIHENYGSPELKISDLAPLIGVGERCLCRRFTEAFGMSPKRYLNELRVKRAKELLTGEATVSEVARLVGFRDLYHFSNFFKSECGTSPSEYYHKCHEMQ